MLSEILTVRDVAEQLKLHPSTAYKLIRAGEIPAFRLGFEWRIRQDVLNKWIDERSRPR